MAAPTNYYVDPAIAGNSGTGTIGDPFGDLQYALNTIVRDATNGDQINIKAGTAEILAAALTLATYGAPAEGAPLVLRGYTAAANDGGIAEINCNGVAMFSSAATFVNLGYLQIHSFGNSNGIALSTATIFRCKIHKGASTPSSKSLIVSTAWLNVIGCHVYDAGSSGVGINVTTGFVYGNYVYSCPTGIQGGQVVVSNIVVDCATGILYVFDLASIVNNTVYSSTANTGTGIYYSNGSGSTRAVVLNNIIEGYSGAGGVGIKGVGDVDLIGYNAFYNNTTPESLGDVILDLGNDATLLASPFTSAAGGDFSLLTTVVGAIDGAFPGAWYGPAATTDHADMGAVQNGAGAGGGGAVRISPIRGGL